MTAALSTGERALSELIAAEQAQWEEPVVEAEVFGVTAPDALARALGDYCAAELGSPVAEALFYSVSVGCVAGVGLADGRRVVVKVQRGQRREAYLKTCRAILRHLRDSGFPCPEPIAGPSRLGRGWAMTDRFEDRGRRRDAHEPAVRRAMAASLARLVELTMPFASDSTLGGAWFSTVPMDRTFPTPHSPLFDFEATRAGAEWIDALALRARSVGRDLPAGRRVVGHFDWRVEHVRFEGDEIVMSFDWDSIHAEAEPVLVGAVAHAFTADWQREDLVRAPSLRELRAFVSDYESARGKPFDEAERRLAAASCAYSLAYTARCNHALSRDGTFNGDLRPLLRAHGVELVEGGF